MVSAIDNDDFPVFRYFVTEFGEIGSSICVSRLNCHNLTTDFDMYRFTVQIAEALVNGLGDGSNAPVDTLSSGYRPM
jgi:hypothetical protein